MKQRQTKRRYLWLEDMAQLQTWLEDQAAAGWMLESSSRWNWGKFRRIEPRRLRYRAEPLPKAFLTTTWDDELEKRRDLYEEMGWEYAGRSALYFIFRTEDLTGPELYDYDLQAENWDRLVKARRRDLWAIALLLAFTVGLIAWSFTQRVAVFLNLEWNILLLLLATVFIVWNGLRTYRSVCRQRKRFRTGAWEQYSPYPTSRLVQFWQMLRQNLPMWLVWVEIIVRFFLIWDGTDSGDAHEFPEARYLPLTVLAEDVAPDEVFVIDYGKKSVWAQVRTRSYARGYVEWDDEDPFDSEKYAAYLEAGGRCFVETDYYDLLGRWTAEVVTEKLVEEAQMEQSTRVDIPGVDEAWYYAGADSGRERLIARTDDRVVDILCGEDLELHEHFGKVAALLEER